MPLVLSCMNDKDDILKLLLAHSNSAVNTLNEHNESAMSMAFLQSNSGHQFDLFNEIAIVQLLLAGGADPNKPVHLLAYAVNFCSRDVCQELLEHGADPNSSFSNAAVTGLLKIFNLDIAITILLILLKKTCATMSALIQ